MTTSLPNPGVARIHGAVLTGIHAKIIQVQATAGTDAPGVAIIGVPGDDTWELRDRVRAAILNSGLPWPSAGVTVALGPASLFRRGCGLDLPIAVAIMAATGAVPAGAATKCVFAAELGLDGRLRPVRGIVPVLDAAAARGGDVTAVVAPENRPEAALLPGVTIAACGWLRELAGCAGNACGRTPHSRYPAAHPHRAGALTWTCPCLPFLPHFGPCSRPVRRAATTSA